VTTPPGMARPTSATGTLARYGFADAARAQATLAALEVAEGPGRDFDNTRVRALIQECLLG